MDTPHYTGVGSRTSNVEICKLFTYLGAELGNRGWRLRSGHADGPDIHFEEGSPKWLGSDAYSGQLGREIFLPWKKFNGRRQHFDPFSLTDPGEATNRKLLDALYDDEGYYVPDTHWPTYEKAVEIAKSVIPWWDKLKPSHRRMHTRNVYQVLGLLLDTPSKMLVCNAPLDGKGEPKGGTRTAIKIAELYDVPVFNRQTYDSDDAFIEAVLDFAINLNGETRGTDNYTESQKPTTPKVDVAVDSDRGTVVSSTENAVEDGSGTADDKGSQSSD